MKLYTKKGDGGETRLGSGEEVAKDHIRVAAYGEVDELNSAIGLASVVCDDAAWVSRLHQTQDRLLVLGAELADAGQADDAIRLGRADVARLEGWIDEADEAVSPLKAFILPGGCELAARLHLARTVCRRMERLVVTLSRHQQVSPQVIPFVNRLGDLLFAWARLANKRAGVDDVIWRAQTGPGGEAEPSS
jgi:cob(I)alamin adenosyltransferase